jgi:hypothetical protein
MAELQEETADWNFSYFMLYRMEMMLGTEEEFVPKYGSKFPGFRKY